MKSYILLLAGALTLGFASCTSTFDDINTNKHQATDEMLETDNQKIGAFFSQMEQRIILFKDGTGKSESSDYQVAQNLTADGYSGYMAPTGTWRSGQICTAYYMVDGWYNQLFTRGFSDVMPAWQKVKSASKEMGLDVPAAVADILKVEAMHRVTDMYGPMPYTSFGAGSIGSAYDTQETIYRQFFDELDNAIDVLTPYALTGATTLADYDFIYGGDVASWVRFANTLRLRLAMRVVYADQGLAQQEAEKSVANPVGVIEKAADRAELKHGRLNYFHPLLDMAYNFNDGEIRMNASIDSYMNGYNDPRRAKYFKPAADDGAYHGVRIGVLNMAPAKYAGAKVSNLNVDNSTPIVFITAAESYFLRAEGALRGWSMGGTAKDFYEAGIKMSFEENGAGSADSYISNDQAKPADFTDNTGDGNAMTALSQITVKYDEAAGTEANLERIITQKWIALYPDGCEGWAEFRRTGYPKLFPVVTNLSNGAIDTQTQIRRCPFPTSEYNTNMDGITSGISALGGADNGGTKLWWDKK